MTQYGGADNISTISQTGDFNVVTGVSGISGLQLGNNNSLTITQTSLPGGPGQTAMVQQIGSGNTGVISQTN
jgi:hypothetical protein